EQLIGKLRRRLAQVDELFAVTIRKRLEERPPEQREHRGVRADAERQRQHDGEAEAWRASNASQGEAQIAPEFLDPACAARVAHLFFLERDSAEGAGGRVARRVRRHAATDVFGGLRLEVIPELFVELALDGVSVDE